MLRLVGYLGRDDRWQTADSVLRASEACQEASVIWKSFCDSRLARTTSAALQTQLRARERHFFLHACKRRFAFSPPPYSTFTSAVDSRFMADEGGDMGTLLCYSVCLHVVQRRRRMWAQRPVSPSSLSALSCLWRKQMYRRCRRKHEFWINSSGLWNNVSPKTSFAHPASKPQEQRKESRDKRHANPTWI